MIFMSDYDDEQEYQYEENIGGGAADIGGDHA